MTCYNLRMTNVTVGGRYQVVVPKAAREALGLAPGDLLEVEVRDGAVVFRPVASRTAQVFGHDRDIWADVDPVEYVRGERMTWRD